MAISIKALLQQAEVYRSQGLLTEAENKYNEVADLIKKSDNVKNKNKLLKAVKKKLAAVKQDTDEVENAPTTPLGQSRSARCLQASLLRMAQAQARKVCRARQVARARGRQAFPRPGVCSRRIIKTPDGEGWGDRLAG